MKVTQIKTNKQNKRHSKLVTMDELMKTISNGLYCKEIDQLNDFIYVADSVSRFKGMHRLPVVYPSAEMKTDNEGNKMMTRFNGLLTLTVGSLHDKQEAEAVKQVAAILPSTLAVVLGSSGKSVKILVAAGRPDGILPQTEEEAEAFCQQAYPIVCHLYETVVRLMPAGETLSIMPAIRHDYDNMLHAGFRMTWDRRPYYRPDASPLLIPEGVAVPEIPAMTPAKGHTMGIDATDDKSGSSNTGEETRQLILLLERHYAFRMNTVMGYVEYRSKTLWHQGWMPVDERVQNSLAMNARLEGLNVWDKDITRYLKSNHVRTYNPIDEYLWEVRNKWDGTDHIGRLARTVPTSNGHWPSWFRVWFLGMVAQWMNKNPRYGNSIAPLLISRQGYNKSTFCKSLIPAELQWGYNDNLVLSEKKSVLQAMSQFLLINLDEFNQISPSLQQGFLKNLIQLSSVKVKRPYGKHVEDFPRLASFIATANVNDLLTDPTGSRRFIGIELTGPIDVSYRINHEQLYAQAVTLIERGEPYWLDEEQTRLVMESNRQFQVRSPEEIVFHDLFAIPNSDEEGQWMSTSDIFECIKQKAGSTALRGGNIRSFGHLLSNMEGILRRRSRFGTEYLVKMIAKKP